MNVNDLFDMPPWGHQRFAVKNVISLANQGRHATVYAPTGGGKTAMQIAVLRACNESGLRATLYTNRVLLTEQTMRVLTAHDVHYGLHASSQGQRQSRLSPIQLAQIQTVHSQCVKGDEPLTTPDIVLVDEAHLQAHDTAKEIIDRHKASGATCFGFTATPLGVSDIYPDLIMAGSNSYCRKCGALVPTYVFQGPQIKTDNLKFNANGEFNIQDVRKAWHTAIYGHVFEHWKRHNPDARPTVLFAPGVPESLWFTQQFEKAGVNAAHIDGTDVYYQGEQFKSNSERRAEILEMWRAGDIKIICNRFVLREGIDEPSMYHLILACPIGSLQSYVQTVGRVLRKSEQTPDHVIITDHGGNFVRHGSPNQDYDWRTWYPLHPSLPTKIRIDMFRERQLAEPTACPECGLVRNGRKCPDPPIGCGHYATRAVRHVLQSNGRLKVVTGDVFKPRIVRHKPNTFDLWKQMYYRMRNADRTFAQAEALFFVENHYYPSRSLPYFPTNMVEIYSKIPDVPRSALIPEELGDTG